VSLRITAITIQKHNSSRCSVFVNGEFAFGCSIDIVERYALRTGAELTAVLLDELKHHDDALRTRQLAYAFIAFKPRTKHQVRQRLIAKQCTPAHVEETLDLLEELGYLNDKRYARMFIHDTLRRKHVGLEKIRTDLRSRGISDYDIDDVLSDLVADEALSAQSRNNALAAARKKFSVLAHKESDSYKQRQALRAYLHRKGFTRAEIDDALREVFS
jgi:regulatory protein